MKSARLSLGGAGTSQYGGQIFVIVFLAAMGGVFLGVREIVLLLKGIV